MEGKDVFSRPEAVRLAAKLPAWAFVAYVLRVGDAGVGASRDTEWSYYTACSVGASGVDDACQAHYEQCCAI